MKFEVSNIKKYGIEVIWENKIYTRKSKTGYLPEFYNLFL